MVHAVVTLSCFIQHHFRAVLFSVNVVTQHEFPLYMDISVFLPSPTSVCASECGLMYVHVCLCGLVYVRACVCVRGCVGVGVWACVTVRVFVCSPLYLDWCLIVLLQVTFKTKIYHCNITSQVCSHNH